MLKARWSHCKDIYSAIREIMENGKNTEITVKNYISQPQRGSKDRKFISEAIFNIVKNFRYYEFIAPEKEDRLNGIIAAYLFVNQIVPPDAGEWLMSSTSTTTDRMETAKSMPEILYSVPQWLHGIGKESLTSQWNSIISVSIEKAPVYLRVNTLKTNINKLGKYFKKEGIEFSGIDGDCLKLESRSNLSRDKGFLSGWFEFQDAGSQEIAKFCRPEPGMFVIDACSGAGGKSLHLASLMENHGNILALDVNTTALEKLKIRKERAGADIISISDYMDRDKLSSLIASADVVLCDVPCSATGVMRREPDQKWKLTIEKLQQLIETQFDILSRCSAWVKPGGRLIYATCSVLPLENKDQVDRFLSQHEDFFLADEKQLYPKHNGHDGFFMCMMIRKGHS